MKKALEIINELKKEKLIKDYAIGGAIGVLRWVEPFFTRDLDIFIIVEQHTNDKELIVLTQVYEYLKTKGYDKWTGQWLMVEGVPVEFIPAAGLSGEAVVNAVEAEFEGVATRVISPEYLIALLLSAGRQKDRIKIEMLLKQAEIDSGKLRQIAAKYKLDEKLRSFMKEKIDEDRRQR